MKLRIIPKSRWKQILILCLLIVLVPYLYSRATSTSRQVALFQNENPAAPLPQDNAKPTLRIACYNIAHGRGIADSNWRGGNHEQRTKRLDSIAELLKDIDAEIVVLNEVDFDASWSYGVNQAKYLAEQAGYRYWVEQRNLDFRILGWRWRFGNAILSKYPIREASLIKLSPHALWENYFAGQKEAVVAEIDLAGQVVNLVATHLEYRSEKTRTASVRAILAAITNDETPTFLVGDLNSTPPGFPNSVTDDRGENAIGLLDQTNRFHRHPMHPPSLEELTFHSQDPDRVIDWIMIPIKCRFVSYSAIDSNLSDHRPIVAEISISSND